MTKLYSKPSPKNNDLGPSDETVQFILNYSKALKVNTLKSMKFETILN